MSDIAKSTNKDNKNVSINNISGSIHISYRDLDSDTDVNRNINFHLPVNIEAELNKQLLANPLIGSENLFKFVKEIIESPEPATDKAKELVASIDKIFKK